MMTQDEETCSLDPFFYVRVECVAFGLYEIHAEVSSIYVFQQFVSVEYLL